MSSLFDEYFGATLCLGTLIIGVYLIKSNTFIGFGGLFLSLSILLSIFAGFNGFGVFTSWIHKKSNVKQDMGVDEE